MNIRACLYYIYVPVTMISEITSVIKYFHLHRHSPIIMDNPDYTLTNEERELIERIKVGASVGKTFCLRILTTF